MRVLTYLFCLAVASEFWAGCSGNGAVVGPIRSISGDWTYSATFTSFDGSACTSSPSLLSFVQHDSEIVGTFEDLRNICIHLNGVTDTTLDNAGRQVGVLRGDSIRLMSDHVLLWHRGIVRNGII